MSGSSAEEQGMRSSMPIATVVIPAYNVAGFVRDAVESALDQSFRDTEIVVVDDGSTDETPKVLAAICDERRDSRLRIISQRNAGLSAARNTGIKAARGEFIGFLDADDIWHPRKLETQIAPMLNDPAVGVTFSFSEYIQESGERTGVKLVPTTYRPDLIALIIRNELGNGSSPVVRAQCFRQVGLFEKSLRSCEDYEMWCRIGALTDFQFVCVPKVLTYYRLRAAGLSYNSRPFVQAADRAMEIIRTNVPNVPPEVLQRGHSNHYRVAAAKAASVGHKFEALRLLAHAIRIWPRLVVTEVSPWVLMASLAVPTSMRSVVWQWYNRLKSARRD